MRGDLNRIFIFPVIFRSLEEIIIEGKEEGMLGFSRDYIVEARDWVDAKRKLKLNPDYWKNSCDNGFYFVEGVPFLLDPSSEIYRNLKGFIPYTGAIMNIKELDPSGQPLNTQFNI